MSFEAVVAQLNFQKQVWTDEVSGIQEQRVGFQNIIDQGVAREAELTELLDQINPAIALLEGAFD